MFSPIEQLSLSLSAFSVSFSAFSVSFPFEFFSVSHSHDAVFSPLSFHVSLSFFFIQLSSVILRANYFVSTIPHNVLTKVPLDAVMLGGAGRVEFSRSLPKSAFARKHGLFTCWKLPSFGSTKLELYCTNDPRRSDVVHEPPVCIAVMMAVIYALSICIYWLFGFLPSLLVSGKEWLCISKGNLDFKFKQSFVLKMAQILDSREMKFNLKLQFSEFGFLTINHMLANSGLFRDLGKPF